MLARIAHVADADIVYQVRAVPISHLDARTIIAALNTLNALRQLAASGELSNELIAKLLEEKPPAPFPKPKESKLTPMSMHQDDEAKKE